MQIFIYISEFYGNVGPFHVETDWPGTMDGWVQSAKGLGFNAVDSNGQQAEGLCKVFTIPRKKIMTLNPIIKIQAQIIIINCCNMRRICASGKIGLERGTSQHIHGFR